MTANKRERNRDLDHYQEKTELCCCEVEGLWVCNGSQRNAHAISEQYF